MGFHDGPLISDVNGLVWSSQNVDDMMHDLLMDIYSDDRNLFPLTIKTPEEIKLHYHSFRTLRRTSDTRAIDVRIKMTDIDTVNSR